MNYISETIEPTRMSMVALCQWNLREVFVAARSEPVAWTAGKPTAWKRLREERAKALAQCVETL